MPIYMDRHDVSEAVTAETIAQLHQQDLKIQKEFGCRGLTYWFDDKRKTAFCLIEAPNRGALKKMHDQAHGQVPHSIIEVEPDIVESFLGRIEDPVKAKNTDLNIINDPAFRIIMVITINHPTLTENESSQFRSALRDINIAARKILKAHNGNVVEQTDYHYLVSFQSVTHAVHAASEIHLLGKNFDSRGKGKGIVIKIGLSTGVPVTQKQQIFEDAIKLAERMCGIVKGEVVVSAEVKDLYKSENANSFIKAKTIRSLSLADEIFVTHLMEYLDRVWNDEKFKVDDFVKTLGCSKSQLYRNMIRLTGESPNTFIKNYRLKKAVKLLRRNVGNVSDVAFETGFASPSYFTKCFKKKFGVLPADLISLQ
jgi:AraC-like DNA-binding protein